MPDDVVQLEALRIVLAVVEPTFGTLGFEKGVQGKTTQVVGACAAWGMISFIRAWCPLTINCAGTTPFQLCESGNWKTTRPSTPGCNCGRRSHNEPIPRPSPVVSNRFGKVEERSDQSWPNCANQGRVPPSL